MRSLFISFPSSSMFYIVWNHQLTFINSSSVTDLNLFPLYWIQKFKQSNPGLTLQPNIRFNVGLTWRTRWPPPCWSPSSSVWSPVGSPRSDSPGLHPPPPPPHHLAGRSLRREKAAHHGHTRTATTRKRTAAQLQEFLSGSNFISCGLFRAPSPRPRPPITFSHTHTAYRLWFIHVSLSYFCRSTNNTI